METSWPADWMRAGLAMCVLAVLARDEAHGYVISQRLATAGIGTVKGGTLYPLLARLETDGHVVATWQEGHGGPGRKVFAITDPGREWLREQRGEWIDFTDATRTLLEETDQTPAGTSRKERT